MSRSKRAYTKEFKKDAISMALRSPSIKVAAENLGLPAGTLTTWVRRATTGNNKAEHDNRNANIIDMAEELKKLKKENIRLREEREILKKAATFFVKESK